MTFKNKECAKCNEIQDWIPWKLQFICGKHFYATDPHHSSLTEALTEIIHNDYCGHRYVPPNDVQVRYCYGTFQYIRENTINLKRNDSCTNRDMKPIICRVYRNPFRNLDCLQESTVLTIPWRCFILPSGNYNDIQSDMLTLVSLIDVLPLLQYDKAVTLCTEKEIYLSEQVSGIYLKTVIFRLFVMWRCLSYLGRYHCDVIILL